MGNLSTTDQFFSAIREAGAIQRLVRLLDSGSTNRTTEIAAKTLANLASESSNRKGIRLAGGVPPLMRLLMDKPSEQVSIAQVIYSSADVWTGWQAGCDETISGQAQRIGEDATESHLSPVTLFHWFMGDEGQSLM